MRTGWAGVAGLAFSCVFLAALAVAAPGEPLRIVVPGGPIAPGKLVQLKAVPVGNPLEPERWLLVSGPGSLGRSGWFKAPYIVPADGATVRVRVSRGPRGNEISAEATLLLTGGSYPGADSCAGVDQVQVPEFGEYVALDDLPVAIRTVQAVYPPSARARKIEGGFVVNALICRSGSVIDTFASWGAGVTPEPTLEQAAFDAARQWIFKPGMVAGSPVACWIAIPFSFKP